VHFGEIYCRTQEHSLDMESWELTNWFKLCKETQTCIDHTMTLKATLDKIPLTC
jgi:hypothetical protein